MGEFLKTMPKNEGGRPTEETGNGKVPVSTLAEIGISKNQSSVAQKLADIPAPEFTERIAVIKAGGESLSTAAQIENAEMPIPSMPPGRDRPAWGKGRARRACAVSRCARACMLRTSRRVSGCCELQVWNQIAPCYKITTPA